MHPEIQPNLGVVEHLVQICDHSGLSFEKDFIADVKRGEKRNDLSVEKARHEARRLADLDVEMIRFEFSHAWT